MTASRAVPGDEGGATPDVAQKPGQGVPAYTRWVNRRLARVVAGGGARRGWTPNGVTALSATFSAAGMALLVLATPSLPVAVGVAVALATGYLLDSADGQLARLRGMSSRAGEWMDHVVDAFRSPAIHLCVAVAVVVHRPQWQWLALVALVHALVTGGQFMSQILAESMVRSAGGTPSRGGDLRSWVLLPTDPGVLCWSFLLWGAELPFAVMYCALGAAAVAHAGVSLGRRYRDLRALDAPEARRDTTPDPTPVGEARASASTRTPSPQADGPPGTAQVGQRPQPGSARSRDAGGGGDA
ncbi:MAG: CDP-alcohol phosphatidyltransferase family protein [Propionibacterium sp.]|nr:CDP-alcohol phosphatidyltransferase family protein [Propionibacterium sp.]